MMRCNSLGILFNLLIASLAYCKTTEATQGIILPGGVTVNLMNASSDGQQLLLMDVDFAVLGQADCVKNKQFMRSIQLLDARTGALRNVGEEIEAALGANTMHGIVSAGVARGHLFFWLLETPPDGQRMTVFVAPLDEDVLLPRRVVQAPAVIAVLVGDCLVATEMNADFTCLCMRAYDPIGDSKPMPWAHGPVVGASDDGSVLLVAQRPDDGPFVVRQAVIIAVDREGRKLCELATPVRMGQPSLSRTGRFLAYQLSSSGMAGADAEDTHIRVIETRTGKYKKIDHEADVVYVGDDGDIVIGMAGQLLYVDDEGEAGIADGVKAACASNRGLHYATEEDGNVIVRFFGISADTQGTP